MNDYRIYCFDGAERVWTTDGIDATTDDAAIASARAIQGAVKAEVWQGRRLVASVGSRSAAR